MRDFWQKLGTYDLANPDHLDTYKSILDLIDSSCQQYSQRIAFSNLNQDLTYKELDKTSQAFASYLQNLKSVKKGDRIALMMPNILAYPVACIGALRAGLIVVNTNPLYTSTEMKHQFIDSGAKILVIFSGSAEKASSILKETKIEHVITATIAEMHPWPKKAFWNFMVKYVAKAVPSGSIQGSVSFQSCIEQGQKLPYSRPSINREDLALLQYTGGTTGVSKGAMLTHGNIISNLEQAMDRLDPMYEFDPEVVISPLPLYHIYSFTFSFLGLMCSGHHSVLITNPRNIKTFIATMKRYKFTCFTGINSLFSALCENKNFRKLDFSSLHMTSSGGMTLTSDAANQWRNITGCEILEGYGLTETSPIVSLNTKTQKRPGTIGRPVARTEIKLIDESGADLTLGDETLKGEICVRGPQVMQGYWKKEEETKKSITADGWFKTGDMGVVSSDGFIKIVDRKKDMIIVSGFNVYPTEIEDTVTNHPGILECAAIGVPNKKSGEVVKLFVVKKDPNLDKNDLLAFCRDHLTGYKIPKEIEFRKELPKSPVGKILKKELRP